MPCFVGLLLSLLSLLASVVSLGFAAENRVVSDPVPLAADVTDFVKIQSEVSSTPQGGAIMFVQALMEYAKGHDGYVTVEACRHNNTRFMVHAVHDDDLVDGELSAMDRYRLRRVHPFMSRAYVDGTSPDNCYDLPSKDQIQLAFRPQEKYVGSIESGRYKVYVWSGDKSLTARPITLRRGDEGTWKAAEFSSLVLPVRGYGKCL